MGRRELEQDPVTGDEEKATVAGRDTWKGREFGTTVEFGSVIA